MSQQVRLEQLEHILSEGELVEVTVVMHVGDPGGPVAAGGAEDALDVVGGKGDFGERGAKDDGDALAGLVGESKPEETDAGQ